MALQRVAIILSFILCGCAIAVAALHHQSAQRPSAGAGWGATVTAQSLLKWFCEDDAQCIDEVSRFDIAALKSSGPRRALSKIASMIRRPRRNGLPPQVSRLIRNARAVEKSNDDLALVRALSKVARKAAAASGSKTAATSAQYPFFGFLPQPVGTVAAPSASPLTLSTNCFASIQFSTTVFPDHVDIAINVQNQQQLFCDDIFLLWGGGTGEFLLADKADTFHRKINTTEYSAAEKWILLQHTGVTVFKFPRPLLETIADVLDTVTMMSGFIQNPISAATMADNANFLMQYVQNSTRMQPLSTPRSNGTYIINNLDESMIQSGDFFAIVRYDGLDPMIGWGEGSTAGHTTIALRNAANVLHVCESTVNGSYWPVNGVQCTLWPEWRQRVINAQFNLVLVPLSPKYRALFNATKAWDFFHQHEGFNYGYLNFLFGWIDTQKDDFPCLPPDFSSICLTKEFVPVLATFIDRLAGDSIQNIFRQSLNFRAGTRQLPVPELIQHANTVMNISFAQLYALPEMDDWQYNTTRFFKPAVGRSMVCCVFVCSMWKAAGVFSEIDSDLQCTEQTIWDIGSMNIFDRAQMKTGRPAACQAADPLNELCQLSGDYTFNLKPDLNTRRLYKKMGEKCSSIAPDYIRRPGC